MSEWLGGSQITIKGKLVPESILGPAMVTNGGFNFLTYVGKGGENLYLSTCVVGPGDSPGTWYVSPWEGNTRLTLSNGKDVRTNDRPAIAIYPIGEPTVRPLIAYTDRETGQLMTMSPAGKHWNSAPLIAFPAGVRFHQPLMTVSNYVDQRDPNNIKIAAIIHVCAVDESGALWYAAQGEWVVVGAESCTFSEWEPASRLTTPPGFTGVENWSLTSVDGTGYLYGFTEQSIWIFQRTSDDDEWNFLSKVSAPDSVTINPWAGVCDSNMDSQDQVQVHYTEKNSNILYSGLSTSGAALTDIAPVLLNGIPLQTDQPPAAVSWPGAEPPDYRGDTTLIMIAYKGNGDDKLYFVYGSDRDLPLKPHWRPVDREVKS